MTELEQYIRQYARSIGLNEDIVMRVVMSEGGPQSLVPGGYTRQSEVINKQGVREPSFGPFQMYMAAGALGDRALKAGADPRNPADIYKVAKFAMDTMKSEGLGAWHGWKGDPWAARMGAGTGQAVNMPAAPQGMMAAAPQATGLRHVGGAGSGPANFNTPAAGYPIGSPGGQQQPQPQQPQKPDGSNWDRLGKALAGGLGGMGMADAASMVGAGAIGTLPNQAPAVVPAQAAPIIAPKAADENMRNQLAQLMQQYWIT